MNSDQTIGRSTFTIALIVSMIFAYMVGVFVGREERPQAWKEGFRYGILMYREADLDEDVNYVRWQKSRK